MFKGGQVERQRFILYYAHSPNQWNHSGVLFHGHIHYIKMAPRNLSYLLSIRDVTNTFPGSPSTPSSGRENAFLQAGHITWLDDVVVS